MNFTTAKKGTIFRPLMCPAEVRYKEAPKWDSPPVGLKKDPDALSPTTYILSNGASIEGYLLGRKVKITATEQGFSLHYDHQPEDIPDQFYDYKHYEGIVLDGETAAIHAIPPEAP